MEETENDKTTEEQVGEQECDLAQVQEGLEESTKILCEEFTKGRIDTTMTMTGLQLVRDAREACAQGDPEACRRLALITGFLERVGRKESAH